MSLEEDAATVLDIPMVATKIKLCPAHAADALRVSGAVAKFLGDLGVTPDAAKRTLDGARGFAQLVQALRGPAKPPRVRRKPAPAPAPDAPAAK